ncbi:MAG: hypothetical protein ACTHK7_06050 [Aureliella sp.]
MQVEFQCGCGAKMRAAAEHVGKRARCPKCGSLVEIAAPNRPTRPQPPRAEDPLGLGDLNFPPSQFPANPGPAPSAWPAAASYAAPRKRATMNMRPVWIALAISAACVVAFVGVGTLAYVVAKNARSGAMAGAPGKAAQGSAAPQAPVGPPVSEAEAEDVVKRFVTAVRGRDFNLCKHLFDTDKLYESIADMAGLSRLERRGFLAGARGQPQIWEQVYSHTHTGGDYVVLRPVRRNGEVRVIVRLSSEQAGINYHEYILRRNEQQEVRIDDVYIVAAGSTLKESISGMVMAMLGNRNSSFLSRLTGSDKLAAESGKSLQKIKTLMNAAPAEALKEFDRLPPELQKEKSVMIMKLMVAGAVDPDKHAAVFEEFQRAHPGDASLDLLAIDYYINRNDKANAIASAERLNAFVGGDKLLDDLIGGLKSQ